jgi:hypothetical protein
MRFMQARLCAAAAAVAAIAAIGAVASPSAQAADSQGCEGGGYSITLPDGTTLAGSQRATVAASRLAGTIHVRGKYTEFDIQADTFAMFDYTLTGAPNALDLTGSRRTVVYASKIPDHRGLTLTESAKVQISGADLVISRTGPGLAMKIQAKDCATGGTFQMEPQRGDGTATTITHTLGPGVFYFDNPNFRAREGDVVPFKDTTVTVTARINFANDLSPSFVGRDSAQVATRINDPACTNSILKRDGTFATVQHCGGVSVWSVASGGRMGGVLGEDSVEVAPPPTVCTHKCQAQNRVRGRAVVLGFPFPVPAASRLNPRFP